MKTNVTHRIPTPWVSGSPRFGCLAVGSLACVSGVLVPSSAEPVAGLALPPPLFGGLGLGVGSLLFVFCGVFSASPRRFSPSFFRPSRASWCRLGFRVSLLSFLVPSRALPSPFPRVFVFALFLLPAFPRLFSAFSPFFSLFFRPSRAFFFSLPLFLFPSLLPSFSFSF